MERERNGEKRWVKEREKHGIGRRKHTVSPLSVDMPDTLGNATSTNSKPPTRMALLSSNAEWETTMSRGPTGRGVAPPKNGVIIPTVMC